MQKITPFQDHIDAARLVVQTPSMKHLTPMLRRALYVGEYEYEYDAEQVAWADDFIVALGRVMNPGFDDHLQELIKTAYARGYVAE